MDRLEYALSEIIRRLDKKQEFMEIDESPNFAGKYK